MDNTQRQETFGKLREPCVELSSIGLKFRGNQATAVEVFQAVEPVHKVLKQLAAKNALDEKLAEYAFFPLTHIFNDTNRLSARCLESAVNCLQILVANGWQQRLSPALGKQLIILLTLIIGGSPNQGDGKEPLKPEASEELAVAGFDSLRTIFNVLEGPVAEETIFHEIGTATVVDQTVYILLEGLVDERSDEVCLAAAKALQALYARITDRVVLASIMPRTVSALTKVLKPTTQARRSYKLLQTCLDIFTELVRAVLNDCVATATKSVVSIPPEDDKLVLDDSWLKATTTQIKLALANVIQVRRHERPEVQDALLNLCLMVIEECQATLDDAMSLMVQTVVVLADQEDQTPNKAFTTLVHLATVYPPVLESLKESLHTWLTSFPRIMHSNDETAKQWGVRQISTAFQVLSQVQSGSDLLSSSLASGLCDSVGAAIKGNDALQSLASPGDLNLAVLQLSNETKSFPPVVMGHTSQQQTLKDLRSMIIRLNSSGSGNDITRAIVSRVHALSDESIIAPFWLSLTFLRDNSHFSAGFDDFVSLDHVEQPLSLSARSSMIEELYYTSLTILNEQSAGASQDWRISALALEAIALQAQQLGEAFRPELMDALYPTLQLLASSNSSLQRHAMTCLNVLTTACNYADTSSMIIENVDYLVNSVALKLNTFDVSPYPPQVLFMMVKLCGGRLVPYLDDLVDSIFGILDLYHGYPKLVEMMFKTLGSIVEEGAKKKSLLTIDDGRDSNPHSRRKPLYQQLSISTIANDIADRKARRAKHAKEELADSEGKVSHPKQPWSETYKQPPKEPESVEELLQQAESDEPLPPPKEPEDSEKPLSKTHNLLLHIVKSIPSHLSSPSPYLRRSLLSMLIDVLPVLAQNENSFLPLINDLWNSVATRIIFPSSLTNDSSSKTLIPRTSATDNTSQPGQHDIQEETFVIAAACSAIEAMAKGAGDFMASRIEPEFPRWERLYRRVWEKVRRDAEAANERRVRHQKQQQRSGTQPSSTETNLELNTALLSSLSLAPASASRGTTGPRAFTSHHTLWRALLSLFITVLAYVRLPVAVGDQICEFVVSWIVLFAGAEYYFDSTRRGRQTAGSEDPVLLQSVEGAIQTMEAWNADLTWVLFVQHRCKQRGGGTQDPVSVGSGESHGLSVEVYGEKVSYAVVVF
ncbi:Armadillo-like helical [Penicillium riverlandense]|uniref:Armadillo-like helical n=1 Tax=Penicillium riverlandense TaxID=1903569 RepID=UPI0025477CA4|nr:Armadillo-like helical [Penicillium riverlandense]KAJ5815672.1 Armadillo-like helical [Penicillium riverlandense]